MEKNSDIEPQLNQAGILLEKATKLFNTARYDLPHISMLRAVPEKIMPLAKWMVNEIGSYVNYGRGDMPLTIAIETVSVCNRHCSYCPMGSAEFKQSRKTRAMSDETFETIITNLREIPRVGKKKGFNGALILNDYGEPLLDQKIIQHTKLANESLPEAKIGIFSNGDYLTEEKYLELVAAGIDSIVLTPHDGSFNDNIKNLYAKYQKDGVLHLLEPLTHFQNRGGKVAIPKELLIAPGKRCVSPTYSAIFGSDGQVSICCNDATMETAQGNIKDTPLMEIWDKPYYKELRDALRHGRTDEIPEICKRCRQPAPAATL